MVVPQFNIIDGITTALICFRSLDKKQFFLSVSCHNEGKIPQLALLAEPELAVLNCLLLADSVLQLPFYQLPNRLLRLYLLLLLYLLQRLLLLLRVFVSYRLISFHLLITFSRKHQYGRAYSVSGSDMLPSSHKDASSFRPTSLLFRHLYNLYYCRRSRCLSQDLSADCTIPV